jgi:hypothetical protein
MLKHLEKTFFEGIKLLKKQNTENKLHTKNRKESEQMWQTWINSMDGL